ncbi:unnamed protein product [Candidula unifasciata]|uniref:Ig-like domain-containing protein n=1 Tax=Candidula unifasciata TaxID=100452 RepID=A0A8S3ZGC8_9EUPU|nr:unnamed protein product [Candidula unifasciata]
MIDTQKEEIISVETEVFETTPEVIAETVGTTEIAEDVPFEIRETAEEEISEKIEEVSEQAFEQPIEEIVEKEKETIVSTEETSFEVEEFESIVEEVRTEEFVDEYKEEFVNVEGVSEESEEFVIVGEAPLETEEIVEEVPLVQAEEISEALEVSQPEVVSEVLQVAEIIPEKPAEVAPEKDVSTELLGEIPQEAQTAAVVTTEETLISVTPKDIQPSFVDIEEKAQPTELQVEEVVALPAEETIAEVQPKTFEQTPQVTEVELKEAVDDRQKPEFHKTLRDVVVTELSRVELEVSFFAKPAPTVTWYIDNKPVKSTADFHITTTETKSVMVISEIYPEDEGIYKVVLENEVGRVESEATVTVEFKTTEQRAEVTTEEVTVSTVTTEKVVEETTSLDFEVDIRQEEEEEEIFLEEKPKESPTEVEATFAAPEAPRFTQTLQKELVVLEGSNITLVCFVVGKPTPTVTWFKEEIEITQSTRYISTYENGRCTLTINNVTFEEEAEFICTATNEAGVATTYVDIFVQTCVTSCQKCYVQCLNTDSACFILSMFIENFACINWSHSYMFS